MLDRMLLAAGGDEKLYVEDVFSTYLYTGNGSTQTITNGIDLAGKGGLVWIKSRGSTVYHNLVDTARGNTSYIYSNGVDPADVVNTRITSFNSNGFTLGPTVATNPLSNNGVNYTSWTFREAPKFFDVVTYTGTGSARTIAHSLGVAPGCIIVKRTNTLADWAVYHRGQTSASFYTKLNLTDAQASDSTVWNGTAPTDTAFSVGTSTLTNASGGTYVAYLFAHDAAADGIIQCGSYTGNGSATGPVINLGWEPQWLMIKNASSTGNWQIIDNMRGMPIGSADATLQANLANAESAVEYVSPTATGFQVTSTSTEVNTNGSKYIYIAIRRGPMKTPTVGTSVFSANITTSAYGDIVTVNFAADMIMSLYRDGGVSYSQAVEDRLRGFRGSSASNPQTALFSTLTNGEANAGYVEDVYNTSWRTYSGTGFTNAISYSFRRAPGFFDVVCYTGTGVPRTVNHNLGVAPEMVIIKNRSSAGYSWITWTTALNLSATYGLLALNSTSGVPGFASGNLNGTAPTSTLLSVSGDSNASGNNYVAYLFASCPGVSKVGSYTGNGSSQTINCGFSNGARFFLVKRTDSTGDWWVYDSARGIVAAADPALRLNSTAAEVTSVDAVDTESTGIIVNQEAICNINVNGATYIYLAIA